MTSFNRDGYLVVPDVLPPELISRIRTEYADLLQGLIKNWGLDHVAEVWAVDKPTQRGPARSVEAFDAEGGLIFQIFGVPKEGRDSRPAWRALVDTLETRETEDA